MKAEEVLNNGVGCLGTLVKDTAGATHALTCGVPDLESNETKYLKEALDMITALDDARRVTTARGPRK